MLKQEYFQKVQNFQATKWMEKSLCGIDSLNIGLPVHQYFFHFVGVIKDGKYVFEGKDYEITTRHGFARNNDFDLVGKGENFLKFKFSSNEETLEKYPFEFDFFLIYTITDNGLEIKYEVLNKTKGDMYFSLGAHPALYQS